MKRYILILLALCPSLGGCGSRIATFPNTPPASGVAAEMNRASFSQASLLQQQGKYEHAIIEYRKVMDATSSESERRHAKHGMARCLIEMGKYPAAVATLKPLPFPPVSDCDRQTLAIAGEALLRLEQTAEAESLLEIALDDVTQYGPAPSWKAGCCGNLGSAYLKNGKPAKALILYRQAAKLYARQGNMPAANQATSMANDLETIIHQFASCPSASNENDTLR